MTDECRFVRAQAKNGAAEIELTITAKAVSGRSTGEMRDILTGALEYSAVYGIAFEGHGERLEMIIDSEPRPVLRMLHTQETDDSSAFTDEETVCLKRALQIAADCREYANSALEIALAIYNRLFAEIEYAYTAVAKGIGSPAYRRASTSIGALMDRKAHCQRYAEAFWLAGRHRGLDVETQYGWAGGGVSGNSFAPDVPDYRYFNTALDRIPEGRHWHPEADAAEISSASVRAHSAFSGLQDDAVTVGSLDAAVAFALAQYHAGMEYAHMFIPEESFTVSEAQDALMAAIRQENITAE